MTSHPGFEDDIFISYAHVDNDPLAEGQEGWITLLEQRLRKRLRQLLGEDLKLWRDPKLQGNDVFSDVLLARLKKVASLVSVLSPRYLKSDWCQNELNVFCQRADVQSGLTLGSKSRVFKVVKTYISRDKHPEPLQSMLGYEFYDYDEGSGRAREFSPDIDPIKDQRYWSKLEDLAWDIKQLLETLRAPPPDTPQAPPPDTSKATIYLAASTADLSAERDNLKRELQQHGYRVIPDRELPLTVPELEQAVRAYLQQAELSIHLIGAHYGIVLKWNNAPSSDCNMTWRLNGAAIRIFLSSSGCRQICRQKRKGNRRLSKS